MNLELEKIIEAKYSKIHSKTTLRNYNKHNSYWQAKACFVYSA